MQFYSLLTVGIVGLSLGLYIGLLHIIVCGFLCVMIMRNVNK